MLKWLNQILHPIRYAAYRETFGSKSGKLVLADLMKLCQMSRTSFAPGHPDTTAFNEGKRFMFLEIVSRTGLQPEDVIMEQLLMDEDVYDE